MKILLSAYACEPNKGSEPGVGWHWATELANMGHDVEVLTRANNREVIETFINNSPIRGLAFHYYDVPRSLSWWKRGPRGVPIYYWLWQRGAFKHAEGLVKKTKFDLIHHITFGVFRQPSYLGSLGIPFVVGPVGGAETTPPRLRNSYPLPIRFKERVRDAFNILAPLSPSFARMYENASLIFCKTPETAEALPKSVQAKIQVHLEIGIDSARLQDVPAAPLTGASFLYAGSLVYWKGLHLALKAFAQLKTRHSHATLTIIGVGADAVTLKQLSKSLGIAASVQWVGWIPQNEIWNRYRRFTGFVYPSLHDSSGNVLLEAMSQGLPVICLDTGGPGTLVPAECGVKVETAHRDASAVVADLAAAMARLIEDSDFRDATAERALIYAHERTWSRVVAAAYAEIDRIVDARGQQP